MSSMPTPRETALPSMAASGSLRSTETERQSICFKACLIGSGAASRKRQRLPYRSRFASEPPTA